MYRLATKRSKQRTDEITWQCRLEKQAALCTASGTLCERTLLPVSTNDVNKQ